MTINEELAFLGKEIETAKKTIAGLEGRKSEIMERLQKEFGIDCIADANKELLRLNETITIKKSSIEKDFESLKKQYAW